MLTCTNCIINPNYFKIKQHIGANSDHFKNPLYVEYFDTIDTKIILKNKCSNAILTSPYLLICLLATNSPSQYLREKCIFCNRKLEVNNPHLGHLSRNN